MKYNINLTKIVIIVCYFGNIPDYFELWLKSCEENDTVNFLVFTDQQINKYYPKNVKIEIMTIDDIRMLFSRKLGFNVSLNRPYKLCDFRPAYGILFEDYLKKFDFWGHCDIDQIFGDIRAFINEKILNQYDRILYLGHFSLYRNSEKINNLFKLNGSTYGYKTVFKFQENYAFDEITGIKKIFEKNNIKIYKEKIYADIDVKYTRFCLNDNIRDTFFQVFYWENGVINRAYIEDDIVKVDTFMYLHFQKKHPVNKIKDVRKVDSFYISPFGFIEKSIGIPSSLEIIKLSNYAGYKKEAKEKIIYFIKKIKQLFLVNFRQKRIWVKQKLSDFNI